MRRPLGELILILAAVGCQPGVVEPEGGGAVEPSPLRPPCLPGADVLARDGFELIAGQRVGLLTNRTGRMVDGRRTIDVLIDAPEVELVRLFSPEHGLETEREGTVGDGTDVRSAVPVRSLYGRERRPRREDLIDLDAVLFDLQDVGVRFYTYTTTLFYLLEACSDLNGPDQPGAPKVVVLDRPNPLSSYGPRGPISDESRRSFICPANLPLMHGLTVGELARWHVAQKQLTVDLEVVPVAHWDPKDHWTDTGLGWVPPSPNLRTPESTLLYPMIGMLEATKLSVGRGTDEPFLRLGASWLDGRDLAARLRARPLPGLAAVPIEFTPLSGPFMGEVCGGVHFQILRRDDLRPVESGLRLLRELMDISAEDLGWQRADERLASARVTELVWGRDEPGPSDWESELAEWIQEVGPVLLYQRDWFTPPSVSR